MALLLLHPAAFLLSRGRTASVNADKPTVGAFRKFLSKLQ
jgi:hypothetical protein